MIRCVYIVTLDDIWLHLYEPEGKQDNKIWLTNEQWTYNCLTRETTKTILQTFFVNCSCLYFQIKESRSVMELRS